MERGSVQHGTRLDEALASGLDGLITGAPISPRDREDLDPEAPAANEFDDIDLAVDADRGGVGFFIDHEAALGRSELSRWLLPSLFPGDVTLLVDGARAQEAPDAVIAMLGRLEPTLEFETFGDLWHALGGGVETRASLATSTASGARAPERIAASAEPTVSVDGSVPDVPASDAMRPATPGGGPPEISSLERETAPRTDAVKANGFGPRRYEQASGSIVSADQAVLSTLVRVGLELATLPLVLVVRAARGAVRATRDLAR